VPLAWLTHSIAMVPTLIVAGIALGVFVGGGFLRAQKRGRPDTWLYRQLQWRLALRHPALAALLGGQRSSPARASGPPGAMRRSRCAMSRFKNEVAHLQAHVKTLRLGAGALFVVALLLGFGWWSAPKSLTIHVPPDLRSGSTRKWWDVPPESVYAFTFYIWQQVQRWPTNGEEDYPRNLRALSAYLTPSCRAFLQQDYEYRRASGELRQRVRGIYEIPGRGYGDDPATRVKVVSDRDWIVTLDVSADEYYGSEQVKRALVRYPMKVVRLDIDPERNPFGLALDCYASAPQRIERAADAAQAGACPPTPPATCRETPHEARCLVGPGRRPAGLGFVPASQAVEILRWERCPCRCRWWSARSAWSSSTATCASACRPASATTCACRARAARSTCGRASRFRPRGCNCRTWNPAR
jgi:integrating conjugative element protein (TIGR03746 family)